MLFDIKELCTAKKKKRGREDLKVKGGEKQGEVMC